MSWPPALTLARAPASLIRRRVRSLDLYCSADCAKGACPAGWVCQATTTGGLARACFKDASAPPPPSGPTWLTKKLTGYHAGGKARASIALGDYADAAGTSRDLVVVVACAEWGATCHAMLPDLVNLTSPRIALVVVESEGSKPAQGSTDALLDALHAQLPSLEVVEDPLVATVGPGLEGPIEALPTLVAFDAKTMKKVGRDIGYSSRSEFETQIEQWRALTKK